jgi:hypothetical protein
MHDDGKGNPRLAAALEYASWGHRIVPVDPPVLGKDGTGKKPYYFRVPPRIGPWDATRDEVARMIGGELAVRNPEVIRHWFEIEPGINIGTAPPEGFFFLDIDDTADLGRASIKWGELPLTPTVRSGREGGGLHMLFRVPDGEAVEGSGAFKAAGFNFDIKSGKGYVVAPPSVHFTGRAYAFETGAHKPDDAAVFPDNWWAVIRPRKPRATVPGTIASGATRPDAARLAVEKYFVPSNGQRHESCKRVMRQLQSAGASQEELEDAARLCHETGKLPLKEAMGIARWAARHPEPMGEPNKLLVAKERLPPMAGHPAVYHGEPEEQPAPPKEWEEPEPLDGCIHGDPLDIAFLGVAPVMRDIVGQVATALQIPVEAAALLAISAVGGVAAKRVRVELGPKWQEPANIFALIILESGARKSALMSDLVLTPLAEIERENIVAGAATRAANRDMRATLEKRKANLISKAAKDDDPRVSFDDLRRVNELIASVPEATEPRIVAADVTMETLATLVVENGGRIVVADPEATILGIASGRYNSGNFNAGVLLKGHPGDAIVIDRRDRREVVERPALTLALAVQPGIWQEFLSAAPAARKSGLAARFLYACPAPTVGKRAISPPPVTDAARTDWLNLLRQIDGLPSAIESVVAMHPSAGKLLDALRGEIEPQLAPEVGELAKFADWASKFAGAVGRVALALHMARHGRGGAWTMLEPETMEAAIAIGRCCLTHTIAALDEQGPESLLARRIEAHLRKKGGQAERAAINRATDASPEALNEATALLVTRKRVRVETVKTTGRPKTLLLLNPALAGIDAKSAQ